MSNVAFPAVVMSGPKPSEFPYKIRISRNSYPTSRIFTNSIIFILYILMENFVLVVTSITRCSSVVEVVNSPKELSFIHNAPSCKSLNGVGKCSVLSTVNGIVVELTPDASCPFVV